jgi:tetratricopeptide (TPR) repeat protein
VTADAPIARTRRRPRDPIARAIVLHQRAIAAREAGRYAAAERAARAARLLYARGEGVDHPDVANVLVDLGEIREARDDLAEAHRCYERALARLARLRRDPDPDLARLRIRAATRLGGTLRAAGHHAAANRVYQRALRETITRFGARDLDAAGLLNDIGVLRKHEGRFDAAARCYRRALAIVARSPERNGLPAATLYHNLGGLEHARGRYARGVAPARRSVALREAILGPDHPAVAADVAALAALLDGRGGRARDEAAALYERALRIFRRTLGARSDEVAINLCSLGMLRHAQGRRAEGERMVRRALAIQEAIHGHRHPEVALTAHNLGMLLATDIEAGGRHRDGDGDGDGDGDDGHGARPERRAQAVRLLTRALAAFTATLGARHPHTRRCAAHLRRLQSQAPRPRPRRRRRPPLERGQARRRRQRQR